jgi:K+-transporting ATPase KdpF subunit
MTLMLWLGVACTAGLFAYLLYALLNAEDF